MKKAAHITGTRTELAEALERSNQSVEFLHERLAEIEMAVENQSWLRLSQLSRWEFSRDFLKQIIALARLMYIKNPLIKRSVEVQRHYIWALGIMIKGQDPSVDSSVHAFLEDPLNECVVGNTFSLAQLEVELQITGNLFFAFFPSKTSGKVRIRTIDVDEVDEVRRNPEDAMEPWLYKRTYIPDAGLTGLVKTVQVWYPDWRYLPEQKPPEVDGVPVDWNVPVYHVKAGGLPRMAFGVPEIYSALDWALAYKTFLEDWATIMRSYSRMAMQMSGMKSKGVAAAKSKLGTTISSLGVVETNPSPVAGSWMLTSAGVDIRAVKTAGSTTSAEEGRPLRLMVASGVGLPDTFLGDVDVGNYATSQTLDRPTELKMTERQELWKVILRNIFSFVIRSSARAPGGTLREAGAFVKVARDDGFRCAVTVMPEGRTDRVDVTFPSITERSMGERVRAVVTAVTLGGKPLSVLLKSKRLVAKLILRAVGEKDVDQLVDGLYPEDEEIEKPAPPPVLPGAGAGGAPPPPKEGGTDAVDDE